MTPDNNSKTVEVPDLQEQVRNHIKSHDLFDWHEALTENEMTLLENLLLTFMPLVPPGSIGYEQLMKTFPPPSSSVAKSAGVEEERKIWGQGWDSAITIANNAAVEISDDFNNDDYIEQADAATKVAKRIRQYLGDRSYFPEEFPPSIAGSESQGQEAEGLNDFLKNHLLFQAALVEAVHRYWYDKCFTKGEGSRPKQDAESIFISNLHQTMTCALPNWRHILHKKSERYFGEEDTTALHVESAPRKHEQITVSITRQDPTPPTSPK